MFTSQQKQQIILQAGQAQNPGSTKVQILLASARITQLQQHFKTHRKDKHSRRGLLAIVNKRRKLLKYLKTTDPTTYAALMNSAVVPETLAGIKA